MTVPLKEDYDALELLYLDEESLSSKKLRLVNSHVEDGHSLLDIGSGTGEFIKLEKDRFDRIVGIDVEDEAVRRLAKRFEKECKIQILRGSISDLGKLFGKDEFDCVTCLDVLEHLDAKEARTALREIHEVLKPKGVFILTAPGIFEKMRIAFGMSPTHRHSRSSYGWARICRQAGFQVSLIETVEFPIIRSELLRRRAHLFGKCCLILSVK